MIDSNDLLRMKVLPIDTENRKKLTLPLRYGKVDLKPAYSLSDTSFWETFCKDYCKNCEHRSRDELCDYNNNDEEEYFIIDSISLPVKKK